MTPELEADTKAVIDKLMYGTPIPPEIYDRIRKKAEEITERVYREHGLLDIAVDLVREVRDEE